MMFTGGAPRHSRGRRGRCVGRDPIHRWRCTASCDRRLPGGLAIHLPPASADVNHDGYVDVADPDPADAVIKLNGAPLALETWHVVLHGVDSATPLPSSVASLPGVPAYLTLPVACGEIRRVR